MSDNDDNPEDGFEGNDGEGLCCDIDIARIYMYCIEGRIDHSRGTLVVFVSLNGRMYMVLSD